MARRVVGPVPRVELCSCCGAQVPNTWTDPYAAVQVATDAGRVRTYCDANCEEAHQRALGLGLPSATWHNRDLSRVLDESDLARGWQSVAG